MLGTRLRAALPRVTMLVAVAQARLAQVVGDLPASPKTTLKHCRLSEPLQLQACCAKSAERRDSLLLPVCLSNQHAYMSPWGAPLPAPTCLLCT